MQKKKEIPIMELRAEPLKEVTMNLPEEYVLLKLKFLNNKMVWKMTKQVKGADIVATSKVSEIITKLKDEKREQVKQELEQLTQEIENLEQKKIQQVRQILDYAKKKEEMQKEIENIQKKYLLSELKNETIKKMILDEGNIFQILIQN